MTTIAKNQDLSEKGWKQGVGSVANVVRGLQPALDNEISERNQNEVKITTKLEKTTTKLAEELDSVSKKSFNTTEDLKVRNDIILQKYLPIYLSDFIRRA